jgi:hypothetical protein
MAIMNQPFARCCLFMGGMIIAMSGVADAVPCGTAISAAAADRIKIATWSDIAKGAKAGNGAFALSPAADWALTAILFAGRAPLMVPSGATSDNFRKEDPPSKFFSELGYSDVETARHSVDADLAGVAHAFRKVGGSFSVGIFLGNLTTVPNPIEAIAERRCPDVTIRRHGDSGSRVPTETREVTSDRVNSWADSHTDGFVTNAAREEESGSGFIAGYVAVAVRLHPKLYLPLTSTQKAGVLLVPSADGSQEVLDEAEYSYFKDETNGVQGVAIPACCGATLYAFTADRSRLNAFESEMSPETWDEIRRRFAPAMGHINLGAAFSTESHLQAQTFVTYGGESTAPSQKAGILARGSAFDVGYTTSTLIDNPPCCVDAAPTPPGLPPQHFTLRAGGPVFYVLQGGDGLILFAAGT